MKNARGRRGRRAATTTTDTGNNQLPNNIMPGVESQVRASTASPTKRSTRGRARRATSRRSTGGVQKTGARSNVQSISEIGNFTKLGMQLQAMGYTKQQLFSLL